MWRRGTVSEPSLPEVHSSIKIPLSSGFWRKLVAFSGPGYLVAVGYMDPGNWATDIAGGSGFGYSLLCVILFSSLIAMLLQSLCAKLGIVAGLDLAQACRDVYPRPVSYMLWVMCELAVIACDLAEVIGTAIALKLLFGLPLPYGVCLTAFDVFLVLVLQRYGFRLLECFIIVLISFIAGCFIFQIAAARPDFLAVAGGFIPDKRLLSDPAMLYIAIGIVGATVMPHNLYLHSSIVQTRAITHDPSGKREALHFARLDTMLALSFAFFVNAAILIVAAAVFHEQGRHDVASIEEAHQLLSPMLGVGAASTIFALALLASGQNSAVTATMAGQVVMEGFLQIFLPVWLRRTVTRLIAIVPAVVVAILYGDKGTGQLLVFSQVVLSLQLPFAVIPLLHFTGSRKMMGAEFANKPLTSLLAWLAAAIIIVLNVKLLWDFFGG